MMMEEPAKVMNFYTEESAFSFASGTTEEAKPVTGIAAIKAKLDEVGLLEAQSIDLCGDHEIDAEPTEGGGVRIKVTGWVTFSGMEPRLFSQTFL
ncbi:unnamed protein product, partial [Ascophyllum nodosum]